MDDVNHAEAENLARLNPPAPALRIRDASQTPPRTQLAARAGHAEITIRARSLALGARGPATVSDMSPLKFNVVFEDAGDGWVYAHVQELPEVHTQGEGLDAARVMVREAIELVLEDRRERGEAIPATGWALVEPVEIAA